MKASASFKEGNIAQHSLVEHVGGRALFEKTPGGSYPLRRYRCYCITAFLYSIELKRPSCCVDSPISYKLGIHVCFSRYVHVYNAPAVYRVGGRKRWGDLATPVTMRSIIQPARLLPEHRVGHPTAALSRHLLRRRTPAPPTCRPHGMPVGAAATSPDDVSRANGVQAPLLRLGP